MGRSRGKRGRQPSRFWPRYQVACGHTEGKRGRRAGSAISRNCDRFAAGAVKVRAPKLRLLFSGGHDAERSGHRRRPARPGARCGGRCRGAGAGRALRIAGRHRAGLHGQRRRRGVGPLRFRSGHDARARLASRHARDGPRPAPARGPGGRALVCQPARGRLRRRVLRHQLRVWDRNAALPRLSSRIRLPSLRAAAVSPCRVRMEAPVLARGRGDDRGRLFRMRGAVFTSISPANIRLQTFRSTVGSRCSVPSPRRFSARPTTGA